jgi:hypothetical protein
VSGVVAPGSTDQGMAKRIFLIKKIYFLCSTNFKLLSHIKGNSKKGCDFS